MESKKTNEFIFHLVVDSPVSLIFLDLYEHICTCENILIINGGVYTFLVENSFLFKHKYIRQVKKRDKKITKRIGGTQMQ